MQADTKAYSLLSNSVLLVSVNSWYQSMGLWHVQNANAALQVIRHQMNDVIDLLDSPNGLDKHRALSDSGM